MVLVIILPNTDGEADVRIDDYMVGQAETLGG